RTRMLMIDGLQIVSTRNLHRGMRFLAICLAIALVVGVAAAATPRTMESRRTPLHSVVQSPLKPMHVEPAELLHDVPSLLERPHHPVSRVINMEVTAYCSCPKCCGPNAAGVTASGKDVGYNEGQYVAADPSFAF